MASRCGSISPGDILLAVNGVSLEACSITDAARLLQTSEDIVTLRIQKPDEEVATPLSDEGILNCCQSDLEIIRDDDNDFGSAGVGGLDADDAAQDEEFLSQSADESISHLPPPPRRHFGQKTKRTQHRRGNTASSRMQVGTENPSDSLSSDRLSENVCSGKMFRFFQKKLKKNCLKWNLFPQIAPLQPNPLYLFEMARSRVDYHVRTLWLGALPLTSSLPLSLSSPLSPSVCKRSKKTP